MQKPGNGSSGMMLHDILFHILLAKSNLELEGGFKGRTPAKYSNLVELSHRLRLNPDFIVHAQKSGIQRSTFQ